MAVAYATCLAGPAGIAGHLSKDTQGACLPCHAGPAASDTLAFAFRRADSFSSIGRTGAFLARFDCYQIEGRYPDLLPAAPDVETAREELKQAKEVFQWLNRQLSA